MEPVCWAGPTISAQYINSRQQPLKEALGSRKSYSPLMEPTAAHLLDDFCLMKLVHFMGRQRAEAPVRRARSTNLLRHPNRVLCGARVSFTTSPEAKMEVALLPESS